MLALRVDRVHIYYIFIGQSLATKLVIDLGYDLTQ